MSLEQKVEVLRGALETIREATHAEFQTGPAPWEKFDPRRHICPTCGRASTVKHLRHCWAMIQSEASRALRDTEES